MQVQLDEIRDTGTRRSYEIDSHALPELAALEAAGEYRFIAPLQIEVSLSRIGGMVEVAGSFATQIEAECGRCLKRYQRPLSATFEVTFSNEPIEVHAEDQGDDEEGLELTAEEMGLIPFVGNEIDLGEAVQEQVILALPLRSLCLEDCKGLCPYCGKDLNLESCKCAAPEFGNKFAALKQFKVES